MTRTSVNAVVRDFLVRYATGSGQRSARTRLLELSASLEAGSGAEGRRWTRAELHESRSRSMSRPNGRSPARSSRTRPSPCFLSTQVLAEFYWVATGGCRDV